MTGDTITFREALQYWLKLGFISFGGPTGQIAIMHKDLVEKKKWIAEDHFLQALNFCMLLPGPEAQQLATYIGWLLNGKWGGIIAGGLCFRRVAARARPGNGLQCGHRAAGPFRQDSFRRSWAGTSPKR